MVVEQVNCYIDFMEMQVIDVIDGCFDEGGVEGWCWVFDLIDGIKGFLCKEQYVVVFGLFEDGVLIFGVFGCLNLLIIVVFQN